MGSLDRYLSIIGLPEKEINETTAVGWLKYRNAKPNYQANILSYYRGFANYLKAHGINAFVPDSPYAEHIYIPHIYTKEEISKLFLYLRQPHTTLQRQPFAAYDVYAAQDTVLYRYASAGSCHSESWTD